MSDESSTNDESLTLPPAAVDHENSEAAAPTLAAEPIRQEPAPTAVPKRNGFYVPKWAAAAAVVVAVGGVGFGVGRVTASDNEGSTTASAQSPVSNGRFAPLPRSGGTGSASGGSGSTSGGRTPGSNSAGNGTGSQTAPSTSATAFLGVSVQDATNSQGATIGTVANGSPAANAGLQSGDVVTAIDGTTIAAASDLVTAVHGHQPGDHVTITYQRNGTSSTAQVTLGSPAAASSTPQS